MKNISRKQSTAQGLRAEAYPFVKHKMEKSWPVRMSSEIQCFFG